MLYISNKGNITQDIYNRLGSDIFRRLNSIWISKRVSLKTKRHATQLSCDTSSRLVAVDIVLRNDMKSLAAPIKERRHIYFPYGPEEVPQDLSRLSI